MQEITDNGESQLESSLAEGPVILASFQNKNLLAPGLPADTLGFLWVLVASSFP
jgi:hypothetical protein